MLALAVLVRLRDSGPDEKSVLASRFSVPAFHVLLAVLLPFGERGGFGSRALHALLRLQTADVPTHSAFGMRVVDEPTPTEIRVVSNVVKNPVRSVTEESGERDHGRERHGEDDEHVKREKPAFSSSELRLALVQIHYVARERVRGVNRPRNYGCGGERSDCGEEGVAWHACVKRVSEKREEAYENGERD